MASKIQERLIAEFGGLFDGKTTALDALGAGDRELPGSAAETLTQLGRSVAGLPVGPRVREGPPMANMDGAGQPARILPVVVPMRAESLADAAAELREIAVGVAATTAGTDTRGGSVPATDGGSDSGTSVSSIATTFLESGFGIVPLITGLMGLFSGGTDAGPSLEKYAMPSSLSFDSADIGSRLSAADFDQTGSPRVYATSPAAQAGAGGGSDSVSGSNPPPPSGGSSPQITVNVQAMDAQSFMDYSSQIAQAVRGAMLNLSSLGNDVVNELHYGQHFPCPERKTKAVRCTISGD